jgi:hypothetical protein
MTSIPVIEPHPAVPLGVIITIDNAYANSKNNGTPTQQNN